MPVPITPPEVDVRVLRSRVDDPDLLADELGSSAWLSRAEVVKTDERSSVLSGHVAGRGVIVKTVVTNPIRSKAPAGLGKTRLARQWQGAELLLEQDLPTVEPVLMWSGRSARGHHAETLVLERVEGKTLIRSFANGFLGVGRQHRLAEEVGRLTGRLERAGLLNKDHKPSNIIVCDVSGNGRGGEQPPRLVLIDTGGITKLGKRSPERMLFNLIVEFVGTKTLPRRALIMRALRAYAAETERDASTLAGIFERVERMLAEHGDPTPKDDPLKY